MFLAACSQGNDQAAVAGTVNPSQVDGGAAPDPAIVNALGAGQLDTAFGDNGTVRDTFTGDIERTTTVFLPATDGNTAWRATWISPHYSGMEHWRGRSIGASGKLSVEAEMSLPTDGEPVGVFGPPDATVLLLGAVTGLFSAQLRVSAAAVASQAAVSITKAAVSRATSDSFVLGPDRTGHVYLVDHFNQAYSGLRANRLDATGAFDAAYATAVTAAYPVAAAAVDDGGRILYVAEDSPSGYRAHTLDGSGHESAIGGGGGIEIGVASLESGSGSVVNVVLGAVVDARGRLCVATAHMGPSGSAADRVPTELTFVRVDTNAGTVTKLPATLRVAPSVILGGRASMVLQGESIVVAVVDHDAVMSVARLDANGALDPGFGKGGVTTVPAEAGSVPKQLLLWPKNRITVVNEFGDATRHGLFIARLGAN